jgi:hypothetical protein
MVQSQPQQIVVLKIPNIKMAGEVAQVAVCMLSKPKDEALRSSTVPLPKRKTQQYIACKGPQN